MTTVNDITKLVDFGDNDGESLPLTKCACGRVWDSWDFILGIYPDMAHTCLGCGRRLFFSVAIRVYEILAEEP